MATFDDDTLNKLVELLVGKLSDRLLEQQKKQMNKMQDEMNKLKEAMSKKVEDVVVMEMVSMKQSRHIKGLLVFHMSTLHIANPIHT
jgi:hypothetical protein